MPAIWSKFRAGKSAADKALAKHAGLEPDPQLPPAAEKYRHIPRHAQSDALVGAPGCYKEIDRRAIKQQSRRRSQYATPNYATYGKSRVGSIYGGSEVGDAPRPGEKLTEKRMSKRIDSGFASSTPSEQMSLHYHDRSGSRSPGSSSQEDLPTMKARHRPGSRVGRSGSRVEQAPPPLRRAPQSIRLEDLSVCEMLHDNPNRKVGEAPRLTTPRITPLPSGQTSPSEEKAPKPAKTKRAWRLGRKTQAA